MLVGKSSDDESNQNVLDFHQQDVINYACRKEIFMGNSGSQNSIDGTIDIVTIFELILMEAILLTKTEINHYT
jgi:hypothetical protein